MIPTFNKSFAIIDTKDFSHNEIDNEANNALYELIKSLNFKQIFFHITNTTIVLDDHYKLIKHTDETKGITDTLKKQNIINFQEDSLYCFTSKEVWDKISKKIKNTFFIPRDLDLKKQKKYLRESLNNQNLYPKEALLKLTHQAKRFKYLDDLESVPMNGIYILFEKGEQVNGLERVVRVGTHTGTNLLPARLKQHYEIENKDRSIFRTNLGRALLNELEDPYLEVWSRNNTTRKVRALNLPFRDINKERLLEKEITAIIQNTFTYSLIEVENKEYRLYLETALIASFAYNTIKPSQNWLGLKSPVKKIRESGLWQVQGISRTPLNSYDLAYIKDHLIYI